MDYSRTRACRSHRLPVADLAVHRFGARVYFRARPRCARGGEAANISDNLRVLAEETDQAWSVDAAEPVTAACDASILRHGVTNLVYNAIKYTPNKGAIRIATRRDPAGDALIEVQNTSRHCRGARRADIRAFLS